MKRNHLVLGALFLLAGVAAHADTITTTFNYTGALQYFTAPASGSYEISAFGASRGDVILLYPSYPPPIGPFQVYSSANGAEISGLFNLSGGETLTLLVGGQGGSITGRGNTIFRGGSGGGGGSFVATSTGQPLVVAGSSDGQNTSTSGTTPSISGQLFNLKLGAGGVDGGGGGAAILFGEVFAGGGGGFYTDGVGGSDAGQSFLNGGAGGLAITDNLGIGANGGYGGGSGSSQAGYGAGGGYSGGAGFGGAGGSYLDPSALNPVKLGGGNHGDGSILITEENAPAPIPEPSSIVLLATGLLGAAGVLKRKHL